MSLKEKNLEKHLLQHHPQCKIPLQSWKHLKAEQPISLADFLVNNGIFTLEQMEHILLQLPWDNNSGAVDIPGYKIVDQIGRGGMGEIYKAFDEASKQPFAIKLLLPQYAQNQEFRKRFFREGKIASQLSNPYIVKCIDVFDVHTTLGICFEWSEGGNLRQFVDRYGKLTPIKTLEIAQLMLHALDYCRERGLIHRDIKPENILLPFHSPPKLADFGLARAVITENSANEHSMLTMEGSFVGTINYCSPEQLEGIREIDARSDIYSLGATLFYCLTGHPPFMFQSRYQATKLLLCDKIPVNTRSLAHISPLFAQCLQKMMALKLEDRYQSPREVIEILEQIRYTTKTVPELRKTRAKIPQISRAKQVPVDLQQKAKTISQRGYKQQIMPQAAEYSVVSNTFYPKPPGKNLLPRQLYKLMFQYYQAQNCQWQDMCEVPLPVGEITIGRNSSNDVCIGIPQNRKRSLHLSGSHCKIIFRDDNDMAIVDLNSTNGTFLNDRLLIAQKEYPLQKSDYVDLGKREIRFVVRILSPPEMAKLFDNLAH